VTSQRQGILQWTAWTVLALTFFTAAMTWIRVVADWDLYSGDEKSFLGMMTVVSGIPLAALVWLWRGGFLAASVVMLGFGLLLAVLPRTSIGQWFFDLNLFQFLMLAVAVAILSLPISHLMDRLWVRRYYGRPSRGRDHRNQSSPRGGDAQRSQGGPPRRQRRLPPPR
jgi:hypothetical protein